MVRRRGGALRAVSCALAWAVRVGAVPAGAGHALMENMALLSLRGALESLSPGSGAGLLDGVDASTLPVWTDAGLMAPAAFPAASQEIARGASWPDDPVGVLYSQALGTASHSASTASWEAEFAKDPTVPANLVARANRGDLAFVNAWAAAAGTPAAETRTSVLTWGRFLLSVAGAQTAPSTLLSATPVAGSFPARGQWTVRELLAGERHRAAAASLGDVAVRQRALGALLALVADSNSPTHAARDSARAITRFYTPPATATDDSATRVTGPTLADIIRATDGGLQGIDAGRALIVALATPSADPVAAADALLSGGLAAAADAQVSAAYGGDSTSDEPYCEDCPDIALGVILGLLAVPLCLIGWRCCGAQYEEDEEEVENDPWTWWMRVGDSEGMDRLLTVVTMVIHSLHPALAVANYIAWVRHQHDEKLGKSKADLYLAFTIITATVFGLVCAIFYTLAFRFPAPKARARRRREYGVLINLLFCDSPIFGLEVHFLWEVGVDAVIQLICFIVTCLSFAYSGLVTWFYLTNRIIKTNMPADDGDPTRRDEYSPRRRRRRPQQQGSAQGQGRPRKARRRPRGEPQDQPGRAGGRGIAMRDLPQPDPIMVNGGALSPQPMPGSPAMQLGGMPQQQFALQMSPPMSPMAGGGFGGHMGGGFANPAMMGGFGGALPQGAVPGSPAGGFAGGVVPAA
eukprot:TRINITY_DN375_c4_g3_i1.p1 TRINITY_DN375_c4_g3~~TRINITY_DN375_c4_g3_i1.p1  ORF type:complete len:692 (+),score=208.51 TRINITY_DN375_c4_g3_i1:129-2204(+)